ncbi:protein with type I secretion target domain and SCP-like extracellular domain [Stanieria sp. NIES-3757]|nr:protein with type I secretion target domain and SCP-like extracellular domain [Stanieria sp. NIES-3757]
MTLTIDLYGDTFGYSSQQLDLKSINGSVKENNLTLTFNFFNSIAPASYYQDNSVNGTIYLDLDQDASTGTPLYSNVVLPNQETEIALGYEVSLDLYSESYQPGLVNLFDEEYATIGQVPIVYEENSFQIKIPLTLIEDDGAIDYSAIVGGNYELSDSIPNQGAGKVLLTDTEESEPNDAIASAIDTGLNSDRVGHFFIVGEIGNNPNVEPAKDVDFYQVKLEKGDYLTVDIDATVFGSNLNSKVELFNSQGDLVAVNNGYYGWDAFLNFTANTTNTYYVSVSGVEYDYPIPLDESKDKSIIFPPGSSTGSYNLEITLFSPNFITGTATDNVLNGTEFYDVISGLEGNDDIFGFDGEDRINGGKGNDFIRGGNGKDVIEGDRDNDVIFGDAHEDKINGGDGFDVIFGGEGNDKIKGGNDKDRLFGGKGDDSIWGENGNDFLNGGDGLDRIVGGLGNDVIYGKSGEDTLYGQDGHDLIKGGSGSDYIYAGSGNDTLSGVDLLGLGSYEVDYLAGGLGKDTFILGTVNHVFYDDSNSASTGESDYATITDFNSSEDKIQLHGSPESYYLDFFSYSYYGAANTNVAIMRDGGVSQRDEQIAILENVSADLTLRDSAFVFV